MKGCSAQRAAIAAGVLLIWWVTAGAALAADGEAQPAVSGRLVDGVREVEIAAAQGQRLAVYRGDYVRFRSTGPGPQAPILIPALSVEWQPAPGGPPYVKMETTGDYAFTMGAAGGTIAVVDFREAPTASSPRPRPPPSCGRSTRSSWTCARPGSRHAAASPGPCCSRCSSCRRAGRRLPGTRSARS